MLDNLPAASSVEVGPTFRLWTERQTKLAFTIVLPPQELEDREAHAGEDMPTLRTR